MKPLQILHGRGPRGIRVRASIRAEIMVSFQLQLKKIIQESDGKETTEEGVIQLQTVSFPSLPETGLDLKKGIERALNIPVCGPDTVLWSHYRQEQTAYL